MPGAQQAGIILRKASVRPTPELLEMVDADGHANHVLRTRFFTRSDKYLWNSANPEAFGALNLAERA